VNHCSFDRNRGRRKVMEMEHTLDQQQCGKLHRDPDSSDKIEFQPVDEDIASVSLPTIASRNFPDLEWPKQ
jgi:hypothetical protein